MSQQMAPTADQLQRYTSAVDALNLGEWPKAQQLSMNLLREIPPHAGVYFVAGVAAREQLQMPLAIECLRRAVEINPQRPDYAAQLARALASASQPGDAFRVADQALQLGPTDVMTLDTLAVVFSQVHAYEKAAEMFRRVVEAMPNKASFRFNLATALVFAGEIDAAERELEACIALDETQWKAHLSLAQLRRQTPDNNHVARLEGLLARTGETAGQQAGGDDNPRLFLNLALSKELEDLGRYPPAFEHLVAGKSAGRLEHAYTSARDEALFAAIQSTVQGPMGPQPGFPTDEPIFVFGMPRTGTTLVERIISSHPDVQSAGELQNFGVALKRISASQSRSMLDPDTILRAAGCDRFVLGKEYLESTRPMTGQAARFIDKLPHNFLYAGYIAQALPNAKLICLRRNPMDSCLSNFRQLFALTSPYYDYSFDLLDTGRYYLMFDRLMAHWRKVMPGRILEVDYETIIDQQERSSRELIDFCGLPWNDACLRFEDNDAPVSTASAVQVRSPIYRTALQRWKRYEPQLADLKALLADGGIRVDT